MLRAMERTTLHIVGGESRSRAEQARVAFALGHHAEVYADLGELLDRPPREGIVLAAESGEPGGTRRLIEALGEAGIWSPVVVMAHEIKLEHVVAGVRAGALDYLALPLEMGGFARRLHTIAAEAGPYEERRRREVEALRRIGQLSQRERQVLALLSAGLANKEIAQQLEISPRTVEIHRANMMHKLGAGHAADAVKAWLAAGSQREGLVGDVAEPRRPRFRVVHSADVLADEAADRKRQRQ
jgi:two-component system response regulator FixJ